MLSLRGAVHLYLVLALLTVSVDCANILFFNGMGEGSHFSAAAALGEELVARGHYATFLVSSEFKHITNNLTLSSMFKFITVDTQVLMASFYEQMTQAKFDGVDLFWNKSFVSEITEAQSKECSIVLSFNFLKNLKSRQFDLLIFDPWWSCCVALGDTLKIKKVVLNPASLSPVFLRAFGLYVNPALVREHATGFPERMNFYQRFQNVLLSNSIPVVDHKPFNDALTNAPVLGINLMTYYLDGFIDADLFISSSDPLLYPDMHESAGHISAAGLTAKKAHRLNQELEMFMQSSKGHGVILYSLGTYLTHLPDKFVRIFRQVFAMFSHKVIWQWKGEEFPSNITQNIQILKWIPQNDLLGHNKTRLLICHGGNNGLHEAIYHAVPLLVIPLGGDQYDVAQKVVEKGIGLRLDVTSITVDSLYSAINTLLTDTRYQTNINKMSTLFRDRPQSPRQKAAFWIEHILKYGSGHLHSSARDLNHLQKNLIDVYALILFVICLSIVGSIAICKQASRRLFSAEKKKVE